MSRSGAQLVCAIVALPKFTNVYCLGSGHFFLSRWT